MFGLLASADFDEAAFDCPSADGFAACEPDLLELESDELGLLELESAELERLGLESEDELGFVRLEDDEEDRLVLLLPQLLPEPYDREGGGGE